MGRLVHTGLGSQSLVAHVLHCSPPNLIQSCPALEKILPPYFFGHVPHPAHPIFVQSTLELIHKPRNSRLSPSLSRNSAAQVVAAGFCAIQCRWSTGRLYPVVRRSIQCFLSLKFSSPSNHCISDCLRPCCHMLHSIVVVPLVRHSLGACRPLSTFRW